MASSKLLTLSPISGLRWLQLVPNIRWFALFLKFSLKFSRTAYNIKRINNRTSYTKEKQSARKWQHWCKNSIQVLKYCPKLLLQLTNLCFKLSHFPLPLRNGEIVYFQKLDKDPTLPSSYRPTCLLPTLSKLLEKI